MKKDDIIKILVIIVVIGFIIEMFAFTRGPLVTNQQNKETEEILFGYAEFYGTLRSYQPYLIINNNINKTTQQLIKADKRVEDVRESAAGIVVALKEKRDVVDVYNFLKDMNITSYSDADIELPYFLELNLANGGVVNVSSGGALITKRIEPFINQNSKIKMRIDIIAKNGVMTGYQSVVILPEKVLLTLNATVKKLYSRAFFYTIPWENRNNINVEELKNNFGKENVNYSKKDYIVFKRSLNTSEIEEKKNLPYIKFITEKTATVDANFSDKEIVKNDFGDIVEFPASILQIRSNETPNVEYEKNQSFYYVITIKDDNYSLPKELIVETQRIYEEGSNITVNIEALAIGNHILNKVEAKVA
jgi:hypothetical protein